MIPTKIPHLYRQQHQQLDGCASNTQIEKPTSKNLLALECRLLSNLLALHLVHLRGILLRGSTLEKIHHNIHLIDETSKDHELKLTSEVTLRLSQSIQRVMDSPCVNCNRLRRIRACLVSTKQASSLSADSDQASSCDFRVRYRMTCNHQRLLLLDTRDSS